MESNKLIKLKAAALEKIRDNGACTENSLYDFLVGIEDGTVLPSPFVKSVVELYGDDNEEPVRKFGDFVKGFFGKKDLEERFADMTLDSLRSQKLVEYNCGAANITYDGIEYLISLERELRFYKLGSRPSNLVMSRRTEVIDGEECYVYSIDPQEEIVDDKPYIYLSFSHEDTEAAIEIAEMICRHGYRVRLDSKNDGKLFEKTISRCELFVAVISKSYIKSLLCNKEWEYCPHEGKVGCLPIYVEEVNNAPGYIASVRGALYKYASDKVYDSFGIDLNLTLREKLAEKRYAYDETFEIDFCEDVYVNYAERGTYFVPGPYVYLSFSPSEETEAYKAKELLEKEGYRVLYQREPLQGVEWYQYILEGIELCDIVVAIVSDDYKKSRYCWNDWHFANVFNKKILRLCLNGSCNLNWQADGETVYNYKQLLYVMEYRGVEKYKNAVKPESVVKPEPKEEQPETEESLPEKQKPQITPYEGDKPYIFVSYSHQNSESVFEIVETLQKNGYRVWYDEGIHPATDWSEYLAEKINNCGYFISFMSQEYLDSRYCVNELSYAFRNSKNLLLVYLSNVKLTGGMAMNYDIYQAIHKYKHSDYEKFGEKLMSAEGLNICKD